MSTWHHDLTHSSYHGTLDGGLLTPQHMESHSYGRSFSTEAVLPHYNHNSFPQTSFYTHKTQYSLKWAKISKSKTKSFLPQSVYGFNVEKTNLELCHEKIANHNTLTYTTTESADS